MSIKPVTTIKTEDPKPVIVIPDPNAAKGTVNKVTVTFNGDTKTSKGFTWYTTLASANSDMQLVQKTDKVADFSKATKFSGKYSISTNSNSELLHKAEATGLKPGTSYSFRVGDEKLNLWSETGTIKTASTTGAFTFINLADPQAKSEEEAILASQTFAKAVETVKNSAFVSINGDLVDVGSTEIQWDWLFGHSQNTLLNNTFVAAAGNHEEDQTAQC
ncbi:MAG TPA: fibronectin type III domain-containing protein [Ruminiclostridium sp.]